MERDLTPSERLFRRGIKLLLTLAIIAIGVWLWPKKVIHVRTVVVQKGMVEQIVPSIQAGFVKPKREAQLRATTAGRVANILIQQAERAKKDQVLVELDGESLKARFRLADANMAVGRSALRTAEVRKATARSSLKRNQQLADKGALSPGALERYNAEYLMATEAVKSAEANLAQLRAALDLTVAALEETRIKAPFAGLVSQIHIELGEVVAPASPILDLVDDREITVKAAIDEADIGLLNKGLAVRIVTDAFENQTFWGKLVYISPVVFRDIRQNQNLFVEVGLNGSSAKLKVGMSADVEIITQSHQDVLFVPTSAILRRGNLRQVYVFTSGRARLRSVRTGLTNWERTEVLEGLSEGERIIVSLESEGLADGVQVALEGSSAVGKAAL